MNDFMIYIISGKAGHGKTTLADMMKDLLEEKNIKTVHTSFSKYIKMYAKELTNWNGSEKNKPRDLLQQIGFEIIRQKLGKEDFFVRRLDEDMGVYREFARAVIIEDARLPIEIEYFKEKYKGNCKIIHIIRPNYDNGLTDNQRGHFTEIRLDNYEKYDYTIVNDSALDDLKEKARELLRG